MRRDWAGGAIGRFACTGAIFGSDTGIARSAAHSSSPCPGATSLRGCLRGPVAVELEIASLGGDQLVVGPLLDDAPMFEHHDAPGLANRGETMRDHDRGAPREQAAQAGLDAAP